MHPIPSSEASLPFFSFLLIKKLLRKNNEDSRNFFNKDRELKYNKHICIQQIPSINYDIISYRLGRKFDKYILVIEVVYL